jgi:hypothetical protein
MNALLYWMILFGYSIAAFGLAYIVGHSEITLGLRRYLADGNAFAQFVLALMECPACLGFWIGICAGLNTPWFGRSVSIAVCAGLYTCGANFILGRTTGLISDGGNDHV